MSTNIDSQLQFSPIQLNEDYRRKWNADMNDFICLTKNGIRLNNFIYRVGGLGANVKDNYFLLLKYVEAHYSDSITKVAKDKPHLEGRWCILDNNGNEKKEFPSYKFPYLVKNSCIYSLDSHYYNIETGEFYCWGHRAISSTGYLFLDNPLDDDPGRRGVMKINKKDGTWELFP